MGCWPRSSADRVPSEHALSPAGRARTQHDHQTSRLYQGRSCLTQLLPRLHKHIPGCGQGNARSLTHSLARSPYTLNRRNSLQWGTGWKEAFKREVRGSRRQGCQVFGLQVSCFPFESFPLLNPRVLPRCSGPLVLTCLYIW